MKKTFLSLSLVIVCLTAVVTSCIYDPHTGELVISEIVCVEFDEYETDGDIESRVICDQFREKIIAKLDANGLTLDDVKDIRVRKAHYEVTDLEGHDWDFGFRVCVERGDVDDGPRTLIRFREQSLMDLVGVSMKANMQGAGVHLLDRALDDMVAGADPQVWISLKRDTITPVPSASDPLVFSWHACVVFQAIIDVGTQ
jgi:hypothetical protein